MSKLQRLSIEYNLTEHCNLSCYACDHASPLLPVRFADVMSFEKDIEALAPVFHAQELRLVGGEPLLHPQLLDFVRQGRSSKIAEKIVIITNGVLLHEMPYEFWQLIDDLRISVYPGVRRNLSLEAAAIICAEHNVYFEADEKNSQFQRSLLNREIEDKELVQQVFDACEMARDISCHTVYEGRFYLCSVSPFLIPRLTKLGIDFDNKSDSVALHNNKNLKDEIGKLLTSKLPLRSCRFCLGTSAPWTAHHQMNSKDRQRWLGEEHQDLIDHVRKKLGGEA